MLSPGQEGSCAEQAAGPKHMQHIENTTQLQGLFYPMEARSLPELVWSSDYVLGEVFPLILLFEYEPARNCSSQRDSACQHPDHDMKDLRILDPTLIWGQNSSCMAVDTQPPYLFTL